MVRYHDHVSTASLSHRETACHGQPSVMTTWQISVGGGPHLTAAHSARQGMCETSLY